MGTDKKEGSHENESYLAWTKGEKNMYVIAGLGNPGRQYQGTKHNIGFAVIDKLAEEYHIDVTKFKHKAFFGEGRIQGEKVILLKPQTYMNLSGESIKEVLSFYKIPKENFIVIYDDCSLPVGATRIREQGSAGGHNGIKNIIQHLGSQEFLRIKVGIGEKPNGWDLADYVLCGFTKEDVPLLLDGIDRATLAVSIWLEKGVKDAMNATNRKKATE